MICVDASVAAKWILPEEYAAQADYLFEITTNAGQPIIAPPLLPFEVTNIVRQRVRRKLLSPPEARPTLIRFLAFPVASITIPGLYEAALQLTQDYDLPAAYDAHYVVLADAFGCDLWTDDRPLLRALSDDFPFVRWIGDAPLPSS